MKHKKIISILMASALCASQTLAWADEAVDSANISSNEAVTQTDTSSDDSVAEILEKNVLFHESFDSLLKKWNLNENSGFYVSNHKLMLDNTMPGMGETYITSNVYETANCEIEFDLNISKGEYFGVGFRMQDDTTFYSLRFYVKSGKVLLLKKINGGSYTELVKGYVKITPDADMKIGITLIGEKISVRADETEILSASDSSLKTGFLGFFGKNMKASVDNIEIFKYSNIEYDVIKTEESVTKEAKEIYVSLNGKDSAADGSKENPYKTIEAAKIAARKLKQGSTPVNVIFEGGEYQISDTISFGSADSGKSNAPITYKAAEGEKVVFSAATRLDVTKFEHISGAMKDRLYENVADKVLQLDLKKQGYSSELANFTKSGDDGTIVGWSLKPPIVTLNSEQQHIARWPNDGYNYIYMCDTGDKVSGGTKEKGGTIYYTESTPSRWVNAENLYIEGFLGNYWHGEWAKVASVDPANNAINMKYYTQYGIAQNHRWAAVNLIEELDTPGEWYIDPSSMMFYYYPPHDLTKDDVLEIASEKMNLVTFNGAENITLEGIEFSMTADDPSITQYDTKGGNGVYIGSGSKNITVKNCFFTHIGMNGIMIDSSDVTIDGCVIYDTGFNGILVNSCGDRNTLTDGNVVIQNCDISDTCRDTNRNYYGGVVMGTSTVGVTVKNNMIHDIKNSAIRYSGNGHIMEYNEIYNCCTTASDAGAIYSGRSWAEYGSVIRYNFFHDIGMRPNYGPYLASATFWDDYESGQEFSHNIAYINDHDKTTGLQIGGGVDNSATGNTIVAALSFISGDDRSTNRNIEWSTYALSTLKLNTVPYDSAEFVKKYPKMNTLLKRISDNDGILKLENSILDNLFVDCTTNKISKLMMQDSEYEGNVILDDDYSIFVDPDNLDFRVKKEAKQRLGISDEILDEDFDINKMGIQGDYVPDLSKYEINTYLPKDKSKDLSSSDITLSWSEAPLADSYRYVVAKDPEFKNIVVDETTYFTSIKLDKLENDTTYYWKVYSKNNSRRFSGEYENINGVKSFTTYPYDVLDRSSLETKIQKAYNLLESVKEGDSVGEYKEGTLDLIKEQIAVAEAADAITQGQQSQIDDAAYELNSFINNIEAYTNVGYTTLNITEESEWYSNKPTTIITAQNGSVKIEATTGAETSLCETISNYNVMCFKTKIDQLEGKWVSYGLRTTDKENPMYLQDAYYILVKPDVFELQKHGTVYLTAPNNGKLKEGEWYDIEFGAITTENGINMIFKLNDELIFDYLDKTDPQYKPGMFAVFCANNTVEVAATDKVPTGLYQMSDEILKEISIREEIGNTLNTESADYTETGNWADGEKTAQNEATRYTVTADSTATWLMVSGAKGNAKLYRVWYYHYPTEDGDKNVKVFVRGTNGSYETSVDMSDGTEGYVELGTFTFMDADYIGRLSVTFTGSGEGKLNVSNVKYELVTDDDAENMLK